MPKATPLAERFWTKVRVAGPDECWEWTGAKTTRGYGHLAARREGLSPIAHRTAWFLSHGEAPPSDLHVLHRCDNRGCVNPNHLFLGTHADNMADKKAKGRANRMPGERNPSAKLTEEQVRAIRRASGRRRDIAASFGVSTSTVDAIRYGYIWAHVT